MKTKVAKALVEASEENNCEDTCLRLRKTYSGRGMYGRNTAAVVGQSDVYNTAIGLCVENVVIEATQDGDNDAYDVAEKAKEFISDALDVSRDAMGRDDTVWY